MGLKKFFKTKPKTQEEFESSMEEKMQEKNLPTKSQFKQRERQFGDFAKYANQLNDQRAKKRYSPFSSNDSPSEGIEGQESTADDANPYGNVNASSSQGSNPYSKEAISSSLNSSSAGNPYSGTTAYGSASITGAAHGTSSGNPYASNIGTTNTDTSRGPYAAASAHSNGNNNPYRGNNADQGKTSINNPYEVDDLNSPSNNFNNDEVDLNDDAYTLSTPVAAAAPKPRYETEEEKAIREEDEEVQKVKDDIRNEKIQSIGSLRNTLQMAREAEVSGKNAMGMLGSQSETLMDIESNLALATQQQKISKQKIDELHHYNRSMFKPNVKNPFTKSRRLREGEHRIKQEHITNKIERETQRQEMQNSANRINESLKLHEENEDSVTARYKRERYMAEAKQYQFENNSEDDEMEMEIAENLDEVAKISRNLKKLALAQGEEVDRQNYRLRDIEEKTDKLDINVHMNTVSLSRAK